MLVWIGIGVGDLDVIGDREVGDSPAGKGGADRDVHHPGELGGVVDEEVVLRDVVEQALEVHLLLVAGAED